MEHSVGESILFMNPWHPYRVELAPVMEGPYTILRKVSPVYYEIGRCLHLLQRFPTLLNLEKKAATIAFRTYYDRHVKKGLQAEEHLGSPRLA